ncbi:MAG: universal stress protein [Saprospiraceae bacterium]|nr:universal stress protein [Saprospiraceae bacterium]
MKLLERILLAEDFTESSKNVVTSAIELAKIFKAQLIPMHVLPEEITDKKVTSLLEDAALKKLNETRDRINEEGVESGDPIIEFGSPYDSIVKASIALNANLVIVGSGENKSNKKFKLGTTSERIIQKSEKPVYVVKEDVPLNVQHILCPVDFSTTSKQALTNAITMAHRFKAELTILSVCEDAGSDWFYSYKEKKDVMSKRCEGYKKKFDRFLQGFNLAGLSWHKEFRFGIAADEILKTISGNIVDLLVMGTVGRTGISRVIIGSVTEKVVREVPCSFLMIKAEDVINLQLESDVSDLESHYNIGMQLMDDGFFSEAINQFKLCLNLNSMHVPAYFGIAKVYKTMGKEDMSKIYRDRGKDILDRIWNKKIEQEVRKLRGS